ncbi:hypothetical protein DXG01_007735, partial [Tephrocybe rancida]
RGHDPSGSRGTAVGEYAVLCPACPLPSVNLPTDYETAPADRAWLYALFVGIDANFRLKHLKTSTDERDLGLNCGYAYFVSDTEFKSYLATYGTLIKDDISTCNNHDAIKSASIHGGKGIDASRTGKTECACHNMKRPASIGDLQKGERYVNMDYFFLSSMGQNIPKRVVVSYNIAWRTDGKAPEHGWAAINNVANSTKEMGPGSRCDTLDDHFGDYNWRKVNLIASTFHRKLTEAVARRTEQVEAFQVFDEALPVEDTTEWTCVVQAWEADGSQPNPFASTFEHITKNAVQLDLTKEDEAELREDLTAIIHDDVLPGQLIAQGLELEDHHLDASSLWLPSDVIGRACINNKFVDYEWRLRYTQAHATLHELCHTLILRSQMSKTKDRYVRGQQMLTRSQDLLARVQKHIDAATMKYQQIRVALVNLGGVLRTMGWQSVLRPLLDADLTGLTLDEEGPSEGQCKLSWIWSMSQSEAVKGEDKQEGSW